jgi:hypothetical protein
MNRSAARAVRGEDREAITFLVAAEPLRRSFGTMEGKLGKG